ncbi:hypothetical protein [Sediminibacillus massiliensis]|uniref:hypothetical protein n=1 Tax=Sediminibacillus massiliensis TaxID=1926277 RepID=UPI00098840E1|nr:hypothetical protein [Sediminibacillus massiliensis]
MSFPEGKNAIEGDSPIVIVETAKCRDWQSFSYAPEGWHYLCETIKEYRGNPAIKYQESILHKYYQSFQPKTIEESLFYGENSPLKRLFQPQRNVDQLPWGIAFNMNPNKNNQHFGPNSEPFVQKEFSRTINIYKKIASTGYQPENYKDGYIKGHFLKKKDDYRFILSGGQHRMAALGVLGYEKVAVKIYPKWERVIDIEDAPAWPLVQDGTYKLDKALEIFNAYFLNNGRERAKKINLLN